MNISLEQNKNIWRVDSELAGQQQNILQRTAFTQDSVR